MESGDILLRGSSYPVVAINGLLPRSLVVVPIKVGLFLAVFPHLRNMVLEMVVAATSLKILTEERTSVTH